MAKVTRTEQAAINRLNVKVIKNLLANERLSKQRRAHLKQLLATTYRGVK